MTKLISLLFALIMVVEGPAPVHVKMTGKQAAKLVDKYGLKLAVAYIQAAGGAR